MSPLEIVDALRSGAASPETWRALDLLVSGRVTRAVSAPHDRDDIAQNVLMKFVQQARDGVSVTASHDGEVVRYVDQMVSRCRTDLWRRAQRAPVLAGDDVAARAVAPGSVEGDLAHAAEAARAAALFDRVAEAAVASAPAAWRDARRAAGRQVEALYFSDETVDDVVCRDEGIPPDAPLEERRRAANRAMKQHQRFREAMLATAEALEARGTLSPGDRALVERMVGELRRRQTG